MASSRPGGHGGHQGGGHHDLSEEERQELKAKVLGVIKAILVAATKAGIHVEKFNREYREFLGDNIPYRRLGYSTLEDFLDQNPAVCRIVRKPDGWYVYGRPSEEDAHISRMITAQRSSSKRKAKPKPAPRPRFNPAQQRLWSPTPGFQGNPAGGYNSNSSPHHQQFQSNNRGGFGGQNNQQNSGPGRQFNNSAANRRYPGGSGRFPGGAVNGTSGSAPGGGNRKQQQQQQKLRTPHANSSQMNMFQNFPPPSMPPAAMHQTPPPRPSHQGSLPPHQMGHHQPPRHQTNNNQPNRNNKNQQQQKNNQQQNKPKNTPSPNSQQLPSDHYRQMLAGWLRGQGCEPCAYKTSPVETKASGGNAKGGGKGGKIVKRFLSTVIVSGKRYQTFPEEFPTAEEAEEAVSKIACQKLNINRPSGGAAANNSQNPVLAATTAAATSPSANRQMSNGSSSGGAPHGNNRNSSGTDFGTWSNGMLDGAAANGSSSETLGDRVVQRIVELVGSRTNGVWSTQIEVEYSRKFKGESLPEKWPAALERLEDSMAKLRVDRPIPGDNGRCIILPKLHHSPGGDALAVDTVAVNAVKTPQPSPIVVGNAEVMPATAPVNMAVPPPSVPPQSAAAPSAVARVSPPLLSHPQGPYMGRLPPPLTLPTDTLWDVYVTWVNSTTNVRLRILGDKYSALFDELATNMELHYFEAEKMTPVEKPVMGKLYAAKVEGDWHRVEVTHVDPKTPKITCYFIDHGDEDLFGPEDLRELDPKFLDLAPQAKQVRLAHLEDWKDSSEAQAELSNMALGKSLVAQLQANDENGVSLILWDTSGDDRDVNINAVLRDKLCGHTPGDGITFDDMPPLESFVSGGKPSSESSVQPEVAVNEAVGGATATAAAAAAAAPAAVAAAPVAPMDLEELFAMDLSTFKPLVQTHPPNIDDFFDISVTLAASPSNFTVQSYADEKNLDDLQRDMNSFYGDSKNHHPESPLKAAHLSKDSYFAGKHSDNIWYRVKVNSMLDENTAAVKMVDFGDFAMIPLDQLQPLWPRYRNLPMQAINACLADIVAVNGDWSPSDTVWFTQRVLNKQFVSKVKDVVTDNTDPEALSYKLSVSLFDTSDPDQDIVIDKELVDQGRAVYLCLYRSQMNPNYESRVR